MSLSQVLTILLLSFAPAKLIAAQSAPTNDDCNSAIPITMGTVTGDLAGATQDGGDNLCSCSDEPDVWYSFTSPEAGTLIVDTCGSEALSSLNTILSVHSGCPGTPLNLLACDNDLATCSDHDSLVSIEVSAGQTVFIRVGNFCTFVAAQFRLNVELIPTFDSGCNGDGGNQSGCTACPCMNDAPSGTIGGCLNSTGTAARLTASGSPSISLPQNSALDLRFSLAGAPPMQFAYLGSGASLAPDNPQHLCFGMDSGVQATAYNGLRCAVSSFRRHGGRAADANGEVGLTNSPWGGEAAPRQGIALAAGFAAGQTRYFQAIIREDSQLGCLRDFSTSQSVRLTFTN